MEKYLSAKAQKASLFNTLTTIIIFYICLGQMCWDLYCSCTVINSYNCWLSCGNHRQYQTTFTNLACNSEHLNKFWYHPLVVPVNQ